MDYSDLKRAERFISRAEAVRDRRATCRACRSSACPTITRTARRPACRTPTAYVAENDLALGMIVEAVSHSKFWPQTAIFVVEDDAQNGPDHVDAHRTIAFVISPYTKRGVVDSTMYSTSSMLRTMELILGLQPDVAVRCRRPADVQLLPGQARPDAIPARARQRGPEGEEYNRRPGAADIQDELRPRRTPPMTCCSTRSSGARSAAPTARCPLPFGRRLFFRTGKSIRAHGALRRFGD